jgi:hypothetical protein
MHLRALVFLTVACLASSVGAAPANPERGAGDTGRRSRAGRLFGGLDEIIAAHSALQHYSDMETVRPRFNGATAEARREALMPFLWKELVPAGVIFR